MHKQEGDGHFYGQSCGEEACEEAEDGRARKRLAPHEQRQPRNQLIARLRRALARSCLAVFEPNLIILDEFQKFRNLLQTGDEKDEAAQLAQQLFESAGSKILLLSA